MSESCPSYLQVPGWTNQNLPSYAEDKVEYKHYLKSRRRNSLPNDVILPGFKRVQDSILVHLICMCQEDLVEIYGAMLMTKPNKDIFIN